MKKTLLIGLSFLAFASCKTDKKDSTGNNGNLESEEIQQTPKQPSKQKEVQETKEFSWDDVPVTNADIGEFPYFTPPEGTVIGKGYAGDKDLDFGKLELYVDDAFMPVEGRVRIMSIQRDKDNGFKDWNQYKFDSSFDKYLKSIGAKLIFKGKIPNEKLKALNESDKMNVYNYVVGDPYNNPVSIYAINHPEHRVFVQISSNSAAGDVGVVRLENFEQTITKITADEIKKEIDEKGFATLYINFDTGKSRIKQDSFEIIDEITKMLEQYPDLNVSIEGHTDNVGEEMDNQKLSENRARAVVIALSDEGIDETRLSHKGFGESKPLESNDTEEGKAKNRRVEIRKI